MEKKTIRLDTPKAPPLKLSLTTQEFSRNYMHLFPHGGLVTQVPASYDVGEQVSVEINLNDTGGCLMVPGAIVWRTHSGRKRGKIKASIQFLTEPQGDQNDNDEMERLLSARILDNVNASTSWSATEQGGLAVKEGDIIGGKYQVEHILGAGATASVFQVRHIFIDKIAAIKFAHVNTPQHIDVRQLFINEARMVGRLTHPSIVEMHDFGIDPRFGCYIVMEYLAGQTLEDYLQAKHDFKLVEVYDIMNKTLYGLRYAHAWGVIHSDIKPSNIMLSQGPPGERRRALKILDFGIAHLRGEPNQEDETTVNVAGTPPYMAPERYLGAPPDERSDIYALGITLYELLTGELPFEGPSVDDFKSQHLNTKWIPIGKRRPYKDERGLLENCLDKALAKNPADRFQTADEFLTHVIRAMNDLGIQERPIE